MLKGKIALVTGGAHSIGFAIGRGLAQAGAKDASKIPDAFAVAESLL